MASGTRPARRRDAFMSSSMWVSAHRVVGLVTTTTGRGAGRGVGGGVASGVVAGSGSAAGAGRDPTVTSRPTVAAGTGSRTGSTGDLAFGSGGGDSGGD